MGAPHRQDQRGGTAASEPSAGGIRGEDQRADADLKAEKKTVRDITLAVYEYLVQEKIQEQLAGMEQDFQEKGELALAKEYSRCTVSPWSCLTSLWSFWGRNPSA